MHSSSRGTTRLPLRQDQHRRGLHRGQPRRGLSSRDQPHRGQLRLGQPRSGPSREGVWSRPASSTCGGPSCASHACRPSAAASSSSRDAPSTRPREAAARRRRSPEGRVRAVGALLDEHHDGHLLGGHPVDGPSGGRRCRSAVRLTAKCPQLRPFRTAGRDVIAGQRVPRQESNLRPAV